MGITGSNEGRYSTQFVIKLLWTWMKAANRGALAQLMRSKYRECPLLVNVLLVSVDV